MVRRRRIEVVNQGTCDLTPEGLNTWHTRGGRLFTTKGILSRMSPWKRELCITNCKIFKGLFRNQQALLKHELFQQ